MLYVIQVNLYALVLCLIIYVSMVRNTPNEHEKHAFLRVIVLLTMANLALDIPNVLLEGHSGRLVTWLIYIGNSIAYLLVAITAFFWFLYVDYFIFKDSKRIKGFLGYLLFPILIHFVLVLLNPFLDIYFSVDGDNNYVRGSLFIVHVLISYSYFLMAYIHAIRHRDKLSKRDFYPLIAFPFIPAIGGVIQVLFYGTLLIWPSATLGLLIIHLFMQTRLILIDSLTELYNKREFNKKVFEITKKRPKINQYAGIVIDIDNFKSVNDTYGHNVGDDALRAFGKILEESFKDDDFVARIGGDEFAAILKTHNPDSLNTIIRLIEANIEDLNKTKQFPFAFSFSYGARIYDPHEGKDFKSFIDDLDHYMYTHKKR